MTTQKKHDWQPGEKGFMWNPERSAVLLVEIVTSDRSYRGTIRTPGSEVTEPVGWSQVYVTLEDAVKYEVDRLLCVAQAHHKKIDQLNLECLRLTDRALQIESGDYEVIN